METIFLGLWFFLFVLIPIVFFLTINFSLSNGVEKRDLIFRGVFAAVGYIVLSVLAGGMLLLIVVCPHPEPDRLFSLGKLIGVIVVIVTYGFFGWALNCFVAGEIITFKKLMSNEKSPAIYDED